MRFAVILAAIDDRREEMRFALRKAEEIRIRDDISAVLPLPEIRNGNAAYPSSAPHSFGRSVSPSSRA